SVVPRLATHVGNQLTILREPHDPGIPAVGGGDQIDNRLPTRDVVTHLEVGHLNIWHRRTDPTPFPPERAGSEPLVHTHGGSDEDVVRLVDRNDGNGIRP